VSDPKVEDQQLQTGLVPRGVDFALCVGARMQANDAPDTATVCQVANVDMLILILVRPPSPALWWV
jgi:hypothetical protein